MRLCPQTLMHGPHRALAFSQPWALAMGGARLDPDRVSDFGALILGQGGDGCRARLGSQTQGSMMLSGLGCWSLGAWL